MAASLEHSLEEAEQEARFALKAKQQQLGEVSEAHSSVESEKPVLLAESISYRCIVPNLHGIHARPAAKIAELAGKFAAECF